MLEVTDYDDGSRTERVVADNYTASETVVVSRPVNLYVVGIFTAVIILLLYYKFYILKGTSYNGSWVLDARNEPTVSVQIHTNIMGELIVSDKSGAIGKGVIQEDGIQFVINKKTYFTIPSQNLMQGEGMILKRIMNQEYR